MKREKREPWPEEDIKEAARLRRSGTSYRDIGTKLGKSPGAVYQALHQRGLLGNNLPAKVRRKPKHVHPDVMEFEVADRPVNEPRVALLIMPISQVAQILGGLWQ